MSIRPLLLTAAALVLSSMGATRAVAQTNATSAARSDGKAFAAAIGGRAQSAAKVAPTAESVPGFRGTPNESELFDNPDAIARKAAATAPSNQGYASVRSSLDHRPRVAVADIEATIARGKVIAGDPGGYVSGMAGGGPGSCRELPPANGGAGTYEATCNVGVALKESIERCTTPLVVSVKKTTRFRYWCSSDPGLNGVDDCSAFDQMSCTRVGVQPGRCLQGANIPRYKCAEPGDPIEELSCPGEVPGARLRGTEVASTVEEHRDQSPCATQANDPGCTQQEETCSESDPVTRTIDGVAVTRPCWAWGRSYQCSRKTPAQDCEALDKNTACRLEREDCLTDERPCPTVERVYQCSVPDAPTSAKQFICDGDVYCINGDCETIDRQPNTEFKDAAVALNAASQAGREFDPANLTLFKGERATCHSAVFGVLNCCAGRAFPLIPGAQLLVSLGCAREEVLLHQRDAQGLCTYVGTYCASSVLGICVTKRKAYCCFESKLSRILQEQGRAQLGKAWAKPKNETCQGFTIDEFARLDLSKMDFSEVYAEFQDAAKLPEELSTVETMQRKISDYYAPNGGHR